MQHRKAPKSAGSTEPTSPVLPGIFPVWVLFGSNQIFKNSIRQKSDGKQEKALGFPKKSEGWWSECRDSNPGPLGPEDSAEKSGGALRPVLFRLFQQKVLPKYLRSNPSIRSPPQSGSPFGSEPKPSPAPHLNTAPSSSSFCPQRLSMSWPLLSNWLPENFSGT